MLQSFDQLIEFVDTVLKHGREDAVNGTSIDIHLGSTILMESNPKGVVLDYRRRDPLPTRRIDIDPELGFVLLPGQFILAHSEEVFNLPDDLSAEYKLKSSMARIGIDHANAGWCDPLWSGSVLTLELTNLTQETPIRLRPGDAIGQMVFFRSRPVPHGKSYAVRGRYNNDKSVSTIKE